MKKLILFLSIVLLTSFVYSGEAKAQMGFLPEFLGNAAAPQRTGFSLKFFPSYYYQEDIAAHDIETAFEPQFWIPGFTGDATKDQFQFVIHMPVGYRRQKDATGTVDSVQGIGTLTTTIEYYWHFYDEDDFEFWFDNGITGGYPTGTENNGVHFGSKPYTVLVGPRSYSIGWYQENFIRYKRFMASIMPIAMSYGFKDDVTGIRGGLAVTIMNGSVGFGLNDWAFLGINFGLLLGNVTGSDDGTGNTIPMSARCFVGPAALLAFTKDTSLQIGVVIDAYTKRVNRGQGIAMALWHFF